MLVNKEYAGVQEYYDLQVEDGEHYYAAGAWHHNSSKSWHLNKMASNFLDAYPEAVYILVNAEGTNDAVFLNMLGVDIDRAFFLQPDSGEQAWDACIKAASLARKVFIGVDSLDACTPMAEINDDIADHHMAPAARLNNKGFRKLVAAMKSDITTNDARVTAVFITQLRDNIGVMFGDKKCVHGDSPVLLADGSRVRIRELVRANTPVMVKTVLDDGTLGSALATGFHNNGTGGLDHLLCVAKPGGNGRSRITCTKDHLVRMASGEYKEAGSIKPGEFVSSVGESIEGGCPSRKALILSGLFGDGCLTQAHSNRSSGTHSLAIAHATRQSEYLRWKHQFFDGWVGAVRPFAKGTAEVFSTSPFCDYLSLSRTHGRPRRLSQELLGLIGLREMAVWFMDDGSWTKGHRGWGCGTMTLACAKYSDAEREMLAEHLHTMGIEPTTVGRRCLSWTGPKLKTFAEALSPYIPTSMRYKLPEKLRDDLQGYDPLLWPVSKVVPSDTVVPVEVLYSGPPTRTSRWSQTKFDITVEGTHNYLADGVVVHNCSVGGKGKKFAATTIIRLACVGQLRDDSGGKDAMKITYGMTVEASIVKNKGSGGGDKVRFDLYKENYKGFKRGDIDNVTELIPFLLQYGLMTKAGNRYVLDGTSYTEDSFTKLVKSDSNILTALIDKVKAEVGKRHTVATATVEAEPEEVVEEQPKAKLPTRVKVKSKLKSK